MLEETPREETALTEGIFAVTLLDRLGLGGEVEGGEVFAAHQLHGVVIHVGVGTYVLLVILLNEGRIELRREIAVKVETLFGHAPGHGAVLQTAFGIADDDGGKTRLEKTRSGVRGKISDDGVSRQGGIVASVELEEPGAHGGVADGAADLVARVHVVVPLLVGTLGRGHRLDHGELFGVAAEEGKIVGELEVVDRGVEALCRSHHRCVGLGVEGVEMGHAAVHVEIDDTLRGGDLLQRGGARPGGAGDSRQGTEGADAEKRFGGTGNEMAAGKIGFDSHGRVKRVG